jgi:glycosyltransferase involved in cell wall biosynthesis
MFPAFGLRYAWRQFASRSSGQPYDAYLWGGRTFGRRVVDEGISKADAVYTFNTAGLEILRHAGQNGMQRIMEQTIAPKQMGRRLLAEEHEQHPRWQSPASESDYVEQFIQREKDEWECADIILCGSEFVKRSVAVCGGPAERCRVVPYGVDFRPTLGEARNLGRTLRVLTVGSVNLRKGAPYVMEAAQQFGDRVQFRWVGNNELHSYGVEQLSEHVELTGAVPRSEIGDHYRWADVFLLPSVCEGSATVCYEALSYGLPVVCTSNTGSIVRDGVEGFVVPIRDSKAIADRIAEIKSDSSLYAKMTRNARSRFEREGSLEAYGERLIEAMRQVLD